MFHHKCHPSSELLSELWQRHGKLSSPLPHYLTSAFLSYLGCFYNFLLQNWRQERNPACLARYLHIRPLGCPGIYLDSERWNLSIWRISRSTRENYSYYGGWWWEPGQVNDLNIWDIRDGEYKWRYKFGKIIRACSTQRSSH